MPQTSAPSVFYITNKDFELYKELSTSGPLKGITGHMLFMLAVSYGYYYKERVPLKDKKKDYTRWSYVQGPQELVLKSIAIKEYGDPSIVKDYKLISQLAEEYANGGIHRLKADIHSGEFGSFQKRFEKLLRQTVEKYEE